MWLARLRSRVELALMQAPFGVLACRSCLALAIRDCKDLAWALTREWALPIHAAKTSTWALTWEWALARDTTVWGGDEVYAVVIIDFFLSYLTGAHSSLIIRGHHSYNWSVAEGLSFSTRANFICLKAHTLINQIIWYHRIRSAI